MFEVTSSHIFIINNIDNTIEQITKNLPKHTFRVIRNEEKDDFLIAQASLAIKEAYIASNEKKFILLCGSTFRKEAQNSLLKVLEEPPHNVIFLIITTSKSTILPTILSRMPHKYLKTPVVKTQCELNILKLELKDVYSFLKNNQKISKNEAKALVESILFKINSQNMKLKHNELDHFSKAMKLLDLNSRPINVLTTLLVTLLQLKR